MVSLDTDPSAGLAGCDEPLATRYDLGVLDLDGVVYIGRDPVPGAAEALTAVRGRGMRLCYLTNNASRPPEAVVEHLRALGIPAGVEDVLTSAQVAAALLARRLPPASAVLVVGGAGLHQALSGAGLTPVGRMSDHPAAVVQGFSPDLGWRDLAEGTRGVRAGLPWVATNLDPTVPTRYGPAPGNGTLVAVVATAAGRPPDQVAGKPQPEPFVQAAEQHASSRPLAVGDRLDTDLEGARAAGMDGLLVLTGVSGASDVLGCPPHQRPRYLGADLEALLEPHPPVRVLADSGGVQAECRQAVARAAAAGLEVVHAGPDALDLLRAAAAAAWARADRQPGGTGDAGYGAVLAALRALQPDAGWAR